MSEDKKNRQQLACDYIRHNYVDYDRLRYDLIAQKVQVRNAHSLEDASLQDAAEPLQFRGEGSWRYITNADINTIVCDCCAETGANITAKEILTVLNAGSGYIPRVHPLRDYVRNLPTYTEDQPDWIDFVAQQVRVRSGAPDRPSGCRSAQVPVDGRSAAPVDNAMLFSTASTTSDLQQCDPQCSASETIYSEQRERSEADRLWRGCFKKWFVAMVASWMKDDVVNHQVLVLIGRQGIFKTTWLERLIPPHLRDYCCKLANATQLSKDDRLRIAEFGLINMDELDAMTPRELNAMKSVITASDVNERVAYGYTKERRVRLASFCASSNRREFLTDITGNRRWLPFEVESIQNPFFTILPYNLMYAQALYLIENGYNYWFDLEDINTLEEHNDSFRAQDSEEQLLPILFDIPAEGRGEFMTTAQISERLVSYGNIKKPMSVSRLGMLLGKAGYKAVRRTINSVKLRGWLVYQRDSKEISSLKKVLKD